MATAIYYVVNLVHSLNNLAFLIFGSFSKGFLHMVFPEALILHTMRDPMDTLFSCFRCKFDDAGLEWSLDPAHLSLQYALYLEIMQHFRKVLPGRVVDIR